MGCGTSVDDAPRLKYRKDLNHVWEGSSNDAGLIDYLGDPTDMNPMTKKGFAVSKFATKITQDHLSTYAVKTLQAPIIPMTVRDDRELKHLAMAFGRDAKGRPIQDYYLPQARELSKEDGSNESHIFRKIADMEKDETMMSDGRLTEEPNTIACSVGRSVDSTKAKWACRQHERDDDELRYINRPCDPEIKFKCRIWDGAFTLGVHLENPGDVEACARALKKKAEVLSRSNSPPQQKNISAKKDTAKMAAQVTTNSGASTKTATTVRDDLSREEDHPFAPNEGQA